MLKTATLLVAKDKIKSYKILKI